MVRRRGKGVVKKSSGDGAFPRPNSPRTETETEAKGEVMYVEPISAWAMVEAGKGIDPCTVFATRAEAESWAEGIDAVVVEVEIRVKKVEASNERA